MMNDLMLKVLKLMMIPGTTLKSPEASDHVFAHRILFYLTKSITTYPDKSCAII